VRSVELMSIILLSVWGCSADAPGIPSGPEGPAVCVDGPPAAAWSGPEKVAVTGPAVNVVHEFEGDLLVVVSQNNTLIRYSTTSGRTSVFADLGNDRGPYDLAFDDEFIFVTNYLSNSVSVLDRNGELVREIQSPSFDGPSGIAVSDRALYVSNVDYIGLEEGYGPGHITVIDRGDFSMLGEITTAAKNPQFLTMHNGDLFVSDTGAFGFDDLGAVATSDGAIERWTEEEDLLQPTREVAVLPVDMPARIASPGRPTFVNGKAYVASASAPEVYVLDLGSFEWIRGVQNPIVLYASDRDALHHIVSDGQVVYVSAFNEDIIWRIDPSCDEMLGEPIAAGFDELLEGAHSMVAIKTTDGTDLYVALGLANSLVRISFR
jgi:DNA-binding beta-propeller fold protein YncE